MRSIKRRITAMDFSKEKVITEQAHKNDVDINQIMAKAMRGETSDYIKENQGRYGEVTAIQYHEAQIMMANAKSLFEGMPSKIRNKFDNKPEKFLEYVQETKNHPEMIELGLMKKPAAQKPEESAQINPTSVETQKTKASIAPVVE